jgi:hypothetical protein
MTAPGPTPLDAAHAAMTEDPEDDAARLRFFAALADTPLLLLLETEAEGASLTPRLFPLEEGPVVLAFDADDRLTGFTGAPAPYAEVPGRVIAALLAGQGIGLGLNLGVAPSSHLVSPEGIDWLAATLARDPERVEAQPQAFHRPEGLPEGLIAALDGKLARAGGLATAALLARVDWTGGRRGHLLAFVDAAPAAEAALARAAGEALTFSGVEAGEMDVVFLAGDDPALAPMARVALRFDLPVPQPAAPPQAPPTAPGSDPQRPPRLR